MRAIVNDYLRSVNAHLPKGRYVPDQEQVYGTRINIRRPWLARAISGPLLFLKREWRVLLPVTVAGLIALLIAFLKH